VKIIKTEQAVEFKCDNVYWEAVRDGRKTAELRLLSRSEWGEVLDNPPEHLWLTDLKSGMTLFKDISWFSAVGDVVGSYFVMFCFKADA